MRKYSNLELAQLYDKKDWATLWKIVTPMVKHAVKRCMREGLDPFYVRDDLMQEAYLAAWAALPRWNAFEASLQTWVYENARGAVLKANTRVSNGLVGGRDSGVTVISLHGETAEDDGGDDEQGLARGPESSLTYENPPEGLGDPSEAFDVERLLTQVPEADRGMVRRLCGIGVPEETQEEYARRMRTTRKAVELRLARLRKKLKTTEGFSPKPGKHVMTGRQISRGAHSVRLNRRTARGAGRVRSGVEDQVPVGRPRRTGRRSG